MDYKVGFIFLIPMLVSAIYGYFHNRSTTTVTSVCHDINSTLFSISYTEGPTTPMSNITTDVFKIEQTTRPTLTVTQMRSMVKIYISKKMTYWPEIELIAPRRSNDTEMHKRISGSKRLISCSRLNIVASGVDMIFNGILNTQCAYPEALEINGLDMNDYNALLMDVAIKWDHIKIGNVSGCGLNVYYVC